MPEGPGRLRLIVGLGNPGQAYAESRHNLGFRCVSRFAREQGIEFTKRKSKARIGFGEVAGQRVIVAKPQTFMNLSGESVGPLVRFFKVALSDLLVVYDDVDLPLGVIRIRERGGAAGHKGMKSIISALGFQEFPRLRIGISPDSESGELPPEARSPDFVLGRFSAAEEPVVEAVCGRAAEAITAILGEGISAAMNKYNPS